VSANADESLTAFEALFAAHGGTPLEYLRPHYPRFLATRREFLSSLENGRRGRVLDIGAHWLHQSMLYVTEGFEVVAVDMPTTLELDNVRSLAAAHSIELVAEPDLERAQSLRRIPDDSIDVVLFTEIIEHITFNPVAMWREVYRVMKPGARIVVTTPNAYALRGRAWQWLRFLRGRGSGLSVKGILGTRTYGHHWKEFSRSELVDYFLSLTPDFVCRKALLQRDFVHGPAGVRTLVARAIETLVPLLRPNLHVEIELRSKRHGITTEPSW
jgi:2-polyprenyl-3-methyl-5-hydroxy-6-metoxy-1,4-benzoquinol methylase